MKRWFVLILCADNIGRSPLTHAIMRQYHKLACISAGFDDSKIGKPSHPLLISAAKELGLDLSKYRSVALQPWMLEKANFFVCHDADDMVTIREVLRRMGKHHESYRILMVGTAAEGKYRNILDPDEMQLSNDEFNCEIDAIVKGAHALARDISARPFL